ncbi:MAG: amino acid--tRNA ligase-related protein, partial [Candidatus Ranarchaeia archaeon]
TDLDGTLRIQEDMVVDVISRLVRKHGSLIDVLGGDSSFLKNIRAPFPRMTYTEVLELLQRKGSNIKWGDDIGTKEEFLLTKEMSLPIFITHYPAKIKAFYHMPDPENDRVVCCADLLLPRGNGELIGGGQRVHDKEQLIRLIKDAHLNPSDYQWYIDLRRYGTQPHSGFGLGLARFLRFLLNLPHIRESMAYPRTKNRVYP